MRTTIITYFLCVWSIKTLATHIVGGEIFYDYLGNNQYKITLKVYRDCYNGIPPLDNPAHINIFDKFGNIIKSLDVSLLSVNPVPPTINNACIQAPNTVCVEEGIYEFFETLPPINGGYYIVYQRCCRNQTILNIVSPGGIGASYWEHIPGPEVSFPNSSPRFKKFPPVFICNGLNINFDHSAIDPDGDVLVYSLCDAYNGLDGCCPLLNGQSYGASAGNYCNTPPPSCPPDYPPPPYAHVPYLSPYSGTYPMASNPAITIHPNTGFITGKPNVNGQWVVSVCVSEYRNGQLIGTHQREFQFNVLTCTVTVVSDILDQSEKCEGLTIQFSNQSMGANTFLWNFGDPTSLADTSNLPNPSYTYPDTGTYQVTLIANPNKPCSDTVTKTFYVYPKFAPTFVAPSSQCITNNSFSFNVSGLYASYTQFQWNFGASATPSVSTSSVPTNVQFSNSGIFPITVTVTQQPCQSVLIDSVEIIPKSQISATPISGTLCTGDKILLYVNGENLYHPSYLWNFSNGYSTTDSTPFVSFYKAGNYSYSVYIQTTGLCKDSFAIYAINTISVFPKPLANFVLTPSITSISDADITFTDSSYSGIYENTSAYITQWQWHLGDGSVLNNSPTFTHTYIDYGEYDVSLLITNNYACKDTITKRLIILPEYRFWVPNTFTPNDDGLNDVFLPVVYGVEDYLLEIYDRWGEKIFSATQAKQGWDGTYKNTPCKSDVYVWKISFKDVVSRKVEEYIGQVTLLR